jgi:hypothetical protein
VKREVVGQEALDRVAIAGREGLVDLPGELGAGHVP